MRLFRGFKRFSLLKLAIALRIVDSPARFFRLRLMLSSLSPCSKPVRHESGRHNRHRGPQLTSGVTILRTLARARTRRLGSARLLFSSAPLGKGLRSRLATSRPDIAWGVVCRPRCQRLSHDQNRKKNHDDNFQNKKSGVAPSPNTATETANKNQGYSLRSIQRL